MTKIVPKRRAGMSDEQTENQIAISEFAPKRNIPSLLTADMLTPNERIGDPIRLAQVTAPAVQHIGGSTADQIELVAISIVENAKKGAEVILNEAQMQAGNMVADAEMLSGDMNKLAQSIRAYAEHKSSQLAAFCQVAESTLGTMHALRDHYVGTRNAEITEIKRRIEEEPIDLPTFLRRDIA